jgi:hypothetical protein
MWVLPARWPPAKSSGDRVSRIWAPAALCAQYVAECEGLELAGEGLVERRVLPTVQVGVVAEVDRSFGLIGDDALHELLPAHGLERIVLRVLGADRGDGLHAEVLTADRAGPMAGIEERVLGQAQQLSVQRVIKHAGQRLGGHANGRQEVGAADVADQERVPGEHRVRPARVARQVDDDDRDAFRRVPGRLEDLQADIAELQRVAVLERMEVVVRLRASTEVDGRPHALLQFQMAGHEVRVEMGQDDVLDREAIPRRVVDVPVDVTTRVDDDGRACPLVADQVRRLRQTAEVVLREDHLAIFRVGLATLGFMRVPP